MLNADLLVYVRSSHPGFSAKKILPGWLFACLGAKSLACEAGSLAGACGASALVVGGQPVSGSSF